MVKRPLSAQLPMHRIPSHFAICSGVSTASLGLEIALGNCSDGWTWELPDPLLKWRIINQSENWKKALRKAYRALRGWSFKFGNRAHEHTITLRRRMLSRFEIRAGVRDGTRVSFPLVLSWIRCDVVVNTLA
jgi:hypothetical protein